MALNLLGTMALKSDLNSAKVISRLKVLCHEKKKSQILIITNKDFFFAMLNGTQIRSRQCQGDEQVYGTMALKTHLKVPR